MFKNLIGYQLMSINDGGFIVKKGSDIKHFEFNEDYGDCCGYNELTANLVFNDKVTINNPVITNVELSSENEACGDSLIITFFGENKPIAKISSCSFSGSGWAYGACTWVHCVETNEDTVLTYW